MFTLRKMRYLFSLRKVQYLLFLGKKVLYLLFPGKKLFLLLQGKKGVSSKGFFSSVFALLPPHSLLEAVTGRKGSLYMCECWRVGRGWEGGSVTVLAFRWKWFLPLVAGERGDAAIELGLEYLLPLTECKTPFLRNLMIAVYCVGGLCDLECIRMTYCPCLPSCLLATSR